MRRGIACALVLFLLSGCCFYPTGEKASALITSRIRHGDIQRQSREIELADARQVVVVLVFGGGNLDVSAGQDKLLRAAFVYNVAELEPQVVYGVQDGLGRLDVRQKTDAVPWDRLTTELRNEWQLELTDRVPLELSAAVGASTGEFDLGGMRITDLNLDIGAADMTVRFGKPNPERLHSLRVRSGAARLQMQELANANFDELHFDGGLGSYTFDLSGEWPQSAGVWIQAGASQVVLHLPQDVGVRVCPGELRRADYGGLSQQGDCYVNRLYNQPGPVLEVHLDMGLGQVDIRQAN